jgi:MFS superfamily sulfate permease-like transporter
MEEVKQSLQHFKDQLASERLKRTLTFTRDALEDKIAEVLLLVCILFFLYVFGFLVFDTPFWIPYLLLMPAIIIGRSAFGLYQETKEASTRPKAKEVVAILWKLQRSSFLYALIAAFLLYCLSDSQQIDSPFQIPELLILGLALCAGITWSLYHLISWLSRLRASRRQANRQQAEEPPLQQQVHRPRP